MAQQDNWWQQDRREETTRRTPTGGDDNHPSSDGYDTGYHSPESAVPDDGYDTSANDYNTSPYDSDSFDDPNDSASLGPDRDGPGGHPIGYDPGYGNAGEEDPTSEDDGNEDEEPDDTDDEPTDDSVDDSSDDPTDTDEYDTDGSLDDAYDTSGSDVEDQDGDGIADDEDSDVNSNDFAEDQFGTEDGVSGDSDPGNDNRDWNNFDTDGLQDEDGDDGLSEGDLSEANDGAESAVDEDDSMGGNDTFLSNPSSRQPGDAMAGSAKSDSPYTDDEGLGIDAEAPPPEEDPFIHATVVPEFDESAFPEALYNDTRDQTPDSGGGSSTSTASSDGDSSEGVMESIDEVGEDVAKEAAEEVVKGFILSHIWWFVGGLVVFLMLGMTIIGGVMSLVMLEEEDGISVEEGGGGIPLDFGNHNLQPAVLALSGDVEDALGKHGLHKDWLFVVLGMIQQETGGQVDKYPDVMQSSESQGWPMNTIDNPKESIYYGVLALKNAIDAAQAQGINDIRAILQGYNMNHAFINWMAKEGHTHWTSDLAEWYSMNKVYPAVTGSSSPATAANRSPNSSAWAAAVGKPYYIRNGGDFHYPNAILYHLGLDYTQDGPFVLEDITTGIITEGALSGYQHPIPEGQYQITSEFGFRWGRAHNGIDMQYKGALFHKGGPIYAAADGKVIAAGFHSSMGFYVKIDHGVPGKNDVGLKPDVSITTTYMHLIKAPDVTQGMSIKAGDKVGHEGNTGGSQGEHLHFQLEQGGVPFNPRQIYTFPKSVL